MVLEDLLFRLKQKHSNIKFYIDLNRKAGLGYYSGFCFHIYSAANNNIVQLADGGEVDWNAKLLSDKKELSVTSGFGAELILKIFGNNFDERRIKIKYD